MHGLALEAWANPASQLGSMGADIGFGKRGVADLMLCYN